MTRSTRLRVFGIMAPLSATIVVAMLRLALAQEPPRNFVLLDKRTPVAEITFDDVQGHTRKLVDFNGKVLLLNIWATWCVPCRKEMPALDRLQASLGNTDFEVLPVSIDRGGIEVIRKFYNDVGIRNLAMYADRSGEVLRQVRALGLPTTLLVDGRGQEIGRVVGPAEWDAPEIAEFLKPFIANKLLSANGANQGGPQPQHVPDTPGPIGRGLHWLRSLLNR